MTRGRLSLFVVGEKGTWSQSSCIFQRGVNLWNCVQFQQTPRIHLWILTSDKIILLLNFSGLSLLEAIILHTVTYAFF